MCLVVLKGADKKFATELDIKTIEYAVMEGNKGNCSGKFSQVG